MNAEPSPSNETIREALDGWTIVRGTPSYFEKSSGREAHVRTGC